MTEAVPEKLEAGTSMPPPPDKPPPLQWQLVRFLRRWGFALFIVLVAWYFRRALLPFILAITVAYILAPVVNRLCSIRIRGRTMPRGMAVLLCYIVLIASLGLFFTAFLPRLSDDFARLGREAPKVWERMQTDWAPRLARWLEHRFPSLAPPAEPEEVRPEPAGPLTELPPPPGTVFTVTPLANGDYAITVAETGLEVERADDKHIVVRPREAKPRRHLEDVFKERMLRALAGLEDQMAGLLRLGQALVTGVIELIMNIVLVLMVAAFILIDQARVLAFTKSLVPVRYRRDYDYIVTGIDRGLNGVVRGQLLICLINGVLTYIGLLIFGVKYGILLAVVAGLMSAIPIFGSIISSIPIVVIALVSGSDGIDVLRGLFVLLWILGIHFVEANFLSPRIIGAKARMHPVLVVFALIAGEATYGLIGALLAVPVASIIQTLFIYFRQRQTSAAPQT